MRGKWTRPADIRERMLTLSHRGSNLDPDAGTERVESEERRKANAREYARAYRARKRNPSKED